MKISDEKPRPHRLLFKFLSAVSTVGASMVANIMIPHSIAIASDASYTPQNDVGNHSGPNIALFDCLVHVYFRTHASPFGSSRDEPGNLVGDAKNPVGCRVQSLCIGFKLEE